MRRLAILAVALGSSLLAADSATACSCVPIDAREQLEAADGAFVGRLIEVRELDPPAEGGPTSSADPVDYVYRVGRVYNRGPGLHRGRRVRVRSARSDASCGLPNQVGGADRPVRRSPPSPLARQRLPDHDPSQDASRRRVG